jgi:hypothetical protein
METSPRHRRATRVSNRRTSAQLGRSRHTKYLHRCGTTPAIDKLQSIWSASRRKRSRCADAGRGPKHGRGSDHYFLVGEPGDNAQWLLERRIGDSPTGMRHRQIGGKGT